MGEIPQEGELSHLAVPRLLLALRRQRYDGALVLERDRTSKRVLFQGGVPVFAESNLPSESLGVQLLDDGVIDREQHARVSALVQERGVKEGAALLEMGVLPPRQLFTALKDQVRRRLVSCFAWGDGRFALAPGEATADEAQAFRTEPVALIFEGLVRHWGPERLLAELTPHLDRSANPTRSFERLRSRLADSEPAGEILDRLAAGAPLGKALQDGSSVEALAAAWVVDAAGAVEWCDPKPGGDGDDSEPEIELELLFGDGPAAETGRKRDAPASKRGAPVDDGEIAALRSEVLERHGALGELDHYGVLGVPHDAPPDTIKSAYLKAAKRFHPDALAGQGLGDVRSEATALFARVARAYATLSDPQARRNYDAELAGHATADADRIANAEALFRKGEILLKAGDFGGALPFLEPAVDLWPEDPAYRSALGWALFKKNPPDSATAREHLEKSVELDDRDAKAWFRLGHVLRDLGDEQAGDRALARAREIDPQVSGR